MSQEQFQERIARIQAQRQAEKAAGGAPRPRGVAARPQGTPEGFKVHREHEAQAPRGVKSAAAFGLVLGGLSMFVAVYIAGEAPPGATAEEAVLAFADTVQDPNGPPEAAAFGAGLLLLLLAVPMVPVLGALFGRWGAPSLLAYVMMLAVGGGASFGLISRIGTMPQVQFPGADGPSADRWIAPTAPDPAAAPGLGPAPPPPAINPR